MDDLLNTLLSSAGGFLSAADLPGDLLAGATDMAQRDFKWWFAIVFSLMVASGTYVFKLQISQLAEQRKANAETTNQLIAYLKEDHTKATATLEKVAVILEKITIVLQRFDNHGPHS